MRSKEIKLIIKGYKIAFRAVITQTTAAQIIAFVDVKRKKPNLK